MNEMYKPGSNGKTKRYDYRNMVVVDEISDFRF